MKTATAPDMVQSTRRSIAPRGAALAPILVVALPLISDDPLHYSWAITGLVWCLWVLSLNVIWGYTGLLSLAQLALGGLAGYTVAVLQRDETMGLSASVAVAILLTVLASVLLAAASTRLVGFYFSIITIAFALMVTTVLASWEYTGRTAGLSVPRSQVWAPSVLGVELMPTNPRDFFIMTATVFLVLNAAAVLLWSAPRGRAMRAVRDDAQLARSVGVGLVSTRTIAFALSGALAAVAGILQAWSFQLVVPELYSIDQALVVVMLLVLAGLGSTYAPLIAGLVYVLLYEAAPLDGDLRLGVLGAAVVAIVLIFPAGIAGGVDQGSQRIRKLLSEGRSRR